MPGQNSLSVPSVKPFGTDEFPEEKIYVLYEDESEIHNVIIDR